jgi:hypothetical protein
MDAGIKARWIERLLSGEIEQGRDVLSRADGKKCCLGVLCDIAVDAGITEARSTLGGPDEYYAKTAFDDFSDTGLPEAVSRWAGLPVSDEAAIINELGGPEVWIPAARNSLAALNDSGLTFDQIADLIEQYL